MATVILTAVGAIVGGPFGAQIGMAVGGFLDSRLFAKTRQGPRLTELAVTTSSYGLPVPRHFGRMRTPGQIIWATDLEEHKEKHGSKSGGNTVEYTYTASFAVALSSRPIIDVGRIWADGKLLRGAAGDLKTGGVFRFHTGYGDQQVDPLIASAEGAARTPAHTGMAYAVFEDLQLGDYGNRIPALTFELIGDAGTLTFATLLEGVVADCDAAVALTGLAGIAVEGPVGEVLEMLDPLFPVDCDATGDLLTLRPERLQQSAIALPPAATSDARGDFGGNEGFARKRAPESEQPLSVLRYYDVERDYQPGVQRALGRPFPGQPRSIELPAALAAGDARQLVDSAARRSNWSRQTISWRVAEIDPRIAPGALVTVPDHPGRWRVREWEWHERGVDLSLIRLPTAGLATGLPTDPGRSLDTPDLAAAPTQLAALELPWDGSSARLPPQLVAVTSSASAGWSGAALYVDQGDGALLPLGVSGRARSAVGLAMSALPAASPLLFDRHNAVTITLAGPDLLLTNATMRQLAMGANRALLGNELLQFAEAAPLGGGQWRLSGLWRGRGGSEAAVASHLVGDRFVLLDGSGTLLDPEAVGGVPGTLIAAIGHADPAPVTAPIALRGIGYRPLTPVHGQARLASDGSLILRWVRRARGAWQWDDGVETPLNEQSEAWAITYGPAGAPIASWATTSAELTLSSAVLATLIGSAPAQSFRIAQRGDRGVSETLAIALP